MAQLEQLLDIMKQNTPWGFLTINNVKNAIWSSPSKECYLHRDSALDNSWMNNHSADFFVAIAMKKYLSLDNVFIYTTDNKCNQVVRGINVEDIHCIHIVCNTKKTKATLLMNLFEALRNAIAHGTVCSYNGDIYMISQQKPKKDSPVKFFCRINRDFSLIEHLREEMVSATDVAKTKSQLFAYAVGGSVDEETKSVYISQKNSCVFFVDDFNLKKGKTTEQLKGLINMYQEVKQDSNIYLVIKDSINFYGKDNLCSPDNRIHIINQHQLLNEFQIQSIHLKEDEENT